MYICNVSPISAPWDTEDILYLSPTGLDINIDKLKISLCIFYPPIILLYKDEMD